MNLFKILFLSITLTSPVILHAQEANNRQHKNRNSVLKPVTLLYFLQQNNIAASAFIPESFIATYIRNDFLLKEAMQATLLTQINCRNNRFLLHLDHWGYSKYGQLKLSTGYAKLFGKKLSIALQFHYLMHHAENYTAMHSISFDIAMQAVVTKNMGLAVQISNPARLRYGIVGKVPLPLIFTSDFYYQIATKTLIAMKIEKELNGAFDIDLRFLQQISFLHAGISVSLHQTQIVAGVTWKKWLFDLKTSYNWRLGMGMQVGIVFMVNKER